MALRAVPDHPKFADLKARLKIPRYVALGILESLWHFTGRFTPQGNLGKYDDQQIEAWIEWEGEPGALVRALIESRWVDTDPKFRLLVHDWAIHADKATKQSLIRLKLQFCVPTVHTPGKHVFQAGPLPVPEPVPVPEPDPEAARVPGVSAEELEEAWERHKCFRRNEPRDLAFRMIFAMNGKFQPERFRERHPIWCAHWEKVGWNSFGSLTFLGWIEAGMPLPPPEAKPKNHKPTLAEIMGDPDYNAD